MVYTNGKIEKEKAIQKSFTPSYVADKVCLLTLF